VLDLNQTPPEWGKLAQASVREQVGGAMAYDENHSAVVLHGGRGRFRSGSQNVSGESHWLSCGEIEQPTPTVTTIVGSPTPTGQIATPTVTNTPGVPPTEPPTVTASPTATAIDTETPTATPTETEVPRTEIYLPIAYKK
jgi:hypothetical protein